jgi:hypothetical protein
MEDVLARLRPEQAALCLSARTVLGDQDQARLRAFLAGRFDWDAFWDLAHLHEVVPLVASNIDVLRGVDVPASWRERAVRRRHVTLRANGHLADTLREVLDAIEAAGVDALPVKGLVLAETLYGDIGARPCADLDVLVRPPDLPRAREALRDIGFTQRPVVRYKALVHPFHDPAWGRGSGADHVRLELHWALWADSERRLGVGGLWQRSVEGTLQGRHIRTLSPEDTLLHLAIHRTRSALRLRWIVDVAELLRRHGDELDWAGCIDRADQAGARTAITVVLGLARDLLGASVPPEQAGRLGISWPKRAILERTCGTDALFRQAPAGTMTQQPHLVLRAFEEDGPGAIAGSIWRSAQRPVREALHRTGLVRARSRVASGT